MKHTPLTIIHNGIHHIPQEMHIKEIFSFPHVQIILSLIMFIPVSVLMIYIINADEAMFIGEPVKKMLFSGLNVIGSPLCYILMFLSGALAITAWLTSEKYEILTMSLIFSLFLWFNSIMLAGVLGVDISYIPQSENQPYLKQEEITFFVNASLLAPVIGILLCLTGWGCLLYPRWEKISLTKHEEELKKLHIHTEYKDALIIFIREAIDAMLNELKEDESYRKALNLKEYHLKPSILIPAIKGAGEMNNVGDAIRIFTHSNIAHHHPFLRNWFADTQEEMKKHEIDIFFHFNGAQVELRIDTSKMKEKPQPLTEQPVEQAVTSHTIPTQEVTSQPEKIEPALEECLSAQNLKEVLAQAQEGQGKIKLPAGTTDSILTDETVQKLAFQWDELLEITFKEGHLVFTSRFLEKEAS